MKNLGPVLNILRTIIYGLEEISEEDRQHVNIFKFSYGGDRLRIHKKNPLFCRHEGFIYKSLVGTIFESQELRVESEGNAEAAAINHPLGGTC